MMAFPWARSQDSSFRSCRAGVVCELFEVANALGRKVGELAAKLMN
jgi:hypothetical protein